VRVKDANAGTATNAEGSFTIEAEENDILLVSFIDFVTREVPVNGRTTINVQLQEDAQALEEVVVTGYMTQRKAGMLP
jgi:hypothetical protein